MDKNLEMAKKIASEVERAGGRAYFVGGCVRDALLGRENKDIDIEVHRVPVETLEGILDALGERISMGASFGVLGLRHYDLDIAMPRAETATGFGHKDFAVSVDPFLGEEKAASRRDFTINALMRDVLTGEILDFFGGRGDLARGLIRHVNDRSFGEDPLRVFRGAQFAARFGFEVTPETRALCETMRVDALAGERVMGELEKALLKAAADIFEDERFKTELKANMESGDYYPKAVEKAAETIHSQKLAKLLSTPNNILAVEYLRALRGTDIGFKAVKRVGTNHDSNEVSGEYTSASNIRSIIKQGGSFSSFTPDYEITNPADFKNLERTVLYRMRTMNKDEIAALPDVKEGLENRIYDAVQTSGSLDELLDSVKTKRYTMSRLRRILVYALLGITADLPQTDAPYIRVLAFNKKGAELMSHIKKRSSLPLITNVSDGYNSLDDNAKRIFDIDIRATDIFNLATEKVGECKSDFTRKLKIED